MLSSEEQMQIIKGAISEGYKGPIFKLIDQANVEKGQTASTEQQQEQGLRGSDGNTSMSFPNSEDDFNTKGMDFDLDIRKYDKEGNLVKSYQKVPPGIKSLNMGKEEGTVIETPSQYEDGGFFPNPNQSVSTQVKKETERIDNIPVEEKALRDKQSTEFAAEFDPVTVADAVGMTGIPVISEAGDLVSAGISTARGNYTDAGLSMAGIAAPFAGGAAFKGMKNVAKNNSLYRVVDATGNVQAAKYGSSIPPTGTVGRRSGIQGTIQNNTNFDHISATTDQSWLTGKNNLFDRYGGNNPYVVKLQGHEGKIHQVAEESTDDILAKIRPGSYTNMKVAGPQNQEIVSILGPKGSKVSDVTGVMSKAEYDAAIKKDPNFKFKQGGYRRKQYQDAGFIGPQLPPDYVAPETKSEPVVEEKPVTTKKIIKKKKPIRKKVKPVVNDNSGTRFTPRPDSVKDVKKLQNLLVSEGFDVGKHGADGAWGEDTAKAYDKYIARTDAKEVSWLDRIKGVSSKLNNQGFSQAVQTYAQYTGNALLQGYGLVGEDETYFDVTEDDLRADELGAYKSMLRDNFNKGRGSKIDYRGYSNDPEIANASSSEAARKLLEERGISSTILNDFNPFSGTNKTKEALHTLTGNANYTIDKDGNVYVQDNYDFNYSQNKKGLKAGTTFSELYKHATSNKYEGRGYDNAHSVGDQVKSRVPVNINLGQATDLGLTPSEISQLGEYNPNASGVSTVSNYELLKRGAKKLFGYQRGGFYQEGGKKNVNREKPRGMMLSSPVHTFPTNREYLKTEIDEIVSLEKESDRPKTKKLLEVTNFMENSMGDNKEAYGRTYTNSQASIDEIMLNDLFDKKKDKDGNEVNHSKTQLRYFEKLKRAGLPTNKAKFKEELQNDNPKAAINAMRMVYGKVPESIPEVTDTLGMFNYYNDNYRKNNKIKDLTESKKRFYDGYGRTFKKGGYITRKRKKKYL